METAQLNVEVNIMPNNRFAAVEANVGLDNQPELIKALIARPEVEELVQTKNERTLIFQVDNRFPDQRIKDVIREVVAAHFGES
jgi:hypothetical protein